MSFIFYITQTIFIIEIDVVIYTYHLQRVQKYYYILGDCLFDSIAYLLHYSQTSIQLRQQCTNHFSISIQNISHSLQETLSIHFSPTFLFEDLKIISIQVYIQKMSISANDEGLWGDNIAIYFLVFYMDKPIYIWSKKNMMICLSIGEEFISSQSFQLLYHDDGPNSLNSHYEPIVTHQLQWSQNQFNSIMTTTNSSFNENTNQSLHDRQKQLSSSNIVQQKKISLVTQP